MTRFLVALSTLVGLVAITLAVRVGTAGVSAQTAPVVAEPAQTITVVGEGEASGTPDVAMVTLSVQNEARTAREAIDANSTAMQGVIDALKRIGIPEARLRTSGISLNPVRAQPRPGDPQPPPITGYQAVNTLNVTVEPATKVGEAIDVAVGAGANAVGGVRFAVSDDAELQKRALDVAVKAARVKGEAMAAAAGLRITGVRTMVEEGGQGVPVVRAEAQTFSADARGVVPPVQPGELTLRTRVRVVYSFG
jgi:uncharacterized protein YggE